MVTSVRPDAPDCWQHTDAGWECEIIALQPGQNYRLNVKFKPGAKADVLVRWTHQLPYTLPQNAKLPKIDSRPLTPENSELVFTGSETMSLMQVTVRSKAAPQDVCDGISLVVRNKSE